MRPINLIPAEERRGERAPLRTGPVAYLLVGVLLLGFIGVYALVTTGNSISEREAAVAGVEQDLASSQARAQALQGFSRFSEMEQTRTQTVSDLARSRFDWERVLRELALVIPQDVSLVNLSGSITGSASGGSQSGSGGESIEAPSLTMLGCASGHESVARMVSALRDIDGVTRVGLSNSALSDEASSAGGGEAGCAGSQAVSFDATVAFDGVEVDPASGGIAPPAEPAPSAGDASGVVEATEERDRAEESVDSAQERSQEAVDTLVPGA